MAEYIDKQNVLNDMIQYLGIKSKDYLLPAERALYKRVEQAPAADVVEREKGEWNFVKLLIDHGYKVKECSECKCDFWDLNKWNFCPNCGADMRENDNG